MTSLNKVSTFSFVLKNQKSRRYRHKCNVCFFKPMYIRVVILLRSFNPPNVAQLKIDHRRLIQAL